MVIKKNNKVVRKVTAATTYVKAADEDIEDFDSSDFDNIDDTDGVIDALDELSDNVEELQDAVDDIEEDEVDIAMNNNIGDHFIAECDRCHGIFISAVVDSDQDIEYVTGVCPLCGKESDQYLKWLIKSVE